MNKLNFGIINEYIFSLGINLCRFISRNYIYLFHEDADAHETNSFESYISMNSYE